MGRHRTNPEKRKYKNNCEFCGAGIGENQTMCGNCLMKRKRIRYMQQMIRDTFERLGVKSNSHHSNQ